MMKRGIDVIVIRGEFTRNIGDKYRDIIVQEYTGDMLWLQDNRLLNIQKENEPFSLIGYIENYINDKSHAGISHLIINYVSLPSVYDVINPIEIVKAWGKASTSDGPFRKYTTTVDFSDNHARENIANLKGISEKMYGYMEIYVYYKEN